MPSICSDAHYTRFAHPYKGLYYLSNCKNMARMSSGNKQKQKQLQTELMIKHTPSTAALRKGIADHSPHHLSRHVLVNVIQTFK